ncbi:MAG: Fe-S cluster protein, partial [Nitrosopumilaceae archaeon]|nr:iron-sulfur cluster assembly scaffold protein [Nitrosopumilaceae archaeon]NIU01048.1 iron-sulfur cluster assembly scaffold protein [Nitrosopumilaceae archaeon]NIU87482.1 Fe-S cluster protein [Nitrosopumilaceae archaeon]NIV65967.1 Fe-S cluster protein [Nitrosopumilaceae archaeon]NIX61650.1 Fe-S cluster protein [Nitrosopumilaceae archaeon]
DLKIDDEKVSDIKFHGKGCAICMACSSVLTEITKGKSLEEVKKISKNDVLGELGLEHLQAVRIKCALLSLKVLKYALYSYLAKHTKETGDIDKLKDEASSLY